MKLQILLILLVTCGSVPLGIEIDARPLISGHGFVGKTAQEEELVKFFRHHGQLKTGRGRQLSQE